MNAIWHRTMGIIPLAWKMGHVYDGIGLLQCTIIGIRGHTPPPMRLVMHKSPMSPEGTEALTSLGNAVKP